MLKELKNTISPVLVVNNSSLKPYVELFEYSPENIYQQPLGSLVGFFEIKEYSQDSAYIVNFLTSVLKKEYYVNPKRPVNESLDSALHKVNMALSEVAKQGNVEWLGNLHAAICVLEKNNAHFSVAGNAKLFLYRSGTLSDISDGLASDSPEPHPLKTFVNVSSGRLEKDDRLLITSEDIFHIFSTIDLRKNFQRFEGDKFVQFLKTALSNQLEMIAAVVVEMTEVQAVKEAKITASRKKSAATVNVFSEKAFAKAQSSTTSLKQDPDEIIAVPEDDLEYTDEKTGHIYVQGETNEAGENGQANIYWDMTKEKISQAWYASKNDIRRRFSLYKKQLAKKRELARIEKEKQKQLDAEEKKREQERKIIEDLEREQQIALEKETAHKLKIEEEKMQREQQLAEEAELERQREADLATEAELQRQREAEKEKTVITEKAAAIEQPESPAQTQELSFREKLALAKQHHLDTADLRQSGPTEQVPEETSGQNPALKTVVAFLQKISKKAQTIFDAKKIKVLLMPHFSKIRNLYASFTSKQKAYALLALALVFIAPLFIARWMNRPKPPTITELVAAPSTQTETLAGEKNMNLAPQNQTVISRNDILTALATSAGTAIVTKTGVVMPGSAQQQEYPLPADSGSAVRATFMHDLTLVFILTDQNKVLSFSPVTLKFTPNNIVFPANSSIDQIGTYLTYLYVLDSKSNQIYRYPRATGGFGAKTDWLKDTTSLVQVSDMTLDDSIYIIQNNQVLKLFKGKAQAFTLEASQTPVHFDKICTTVDSPSLYVLDAKNARVIQFNKSDGSLTAQYFDADLKNGTSLSVDEPNRTAYVSTSSNLISISLQ